MQISGGVQVSDAFQASVGLPLIAIWERMFCVEISLSAPEWERLTKENACRITWLAVAEGERAES
jgi:hypothetical protein